MAWFGGVKPYPPPCSIDPDVLKYTVAGHEPWSVVHDTGPKKDVGFSPVPGVQVGHRSWNPAHDDEFSARADHVGHKTPWSVVCNTLRTETIDSGEARRRYTTVSPPRRVYAEEKYAGTIDSATAAKKYKVGFVSNW